MAEKYTVKTMCGDLRIFEKSIMIEGVARSFYLRQSIDRGVVRELVGLINNVFYLGKNVKAQEVSNTMRSLLKPNVEFDKEAK